MIAAGHRSGLVFGRPHVFCSCWLGLMGAMPFTAAVASGMLHRRGFLASLARRHLLHRPIDWPIDVQVVQSISPVMIRYDYWPNPQLCVCFLFPSATAEQFHVHLSWITFPCACFHGQPVQFTMVVSCTDDGDLHKLCACTSSTHGSHQIIYVYVICCNLAFKLLMTDGSNVVF